ncbi:MAG: porphobilinogen synthase [Verrucomicrobiota bacterium]
MNLSRRPRRNRKSASVRTLVEETTLLAQDLVQPAFLLDSDSAREAVPSLPQIERLGLELMKQECDELLQNGIRGIALFPVFDDALKDDQGSVGLNAGNYFYQSLRELKQTFPELVFFVDVALDPYTSHGYDGLLSADGEVDNDSTVDILCQISCLLAETGIDYVAPSDMMDGRVRAIRQALDVAGHSSTGIMAYSAKYASSCYGPFRDAVGSSKQNGYLDKQGYQLNPANSREAIMELLLDTDEGADIVMVKPAGWYGDIISASRSKLQIPIAAYQVSGEYAMIQAAAERGWMDLEAGRDESLLSIKRAGADLIFTYFARCWNGNRS